MDMISPGDILASVPAMTTVLRVALIAALFAARCPAQTGTVTFYTPGNSAKSVAASLLPKSQQPFTGWLFDGPQRLAHVRPGRFMTFHLTPGAHTFTVPWHSNRPGKDSLVINTELTLSSLHIEPGEPTFEPQRWVQWFATTQHFEWT